MKYRKKNMGIIWIVAALMVLSVFSVAIFAASANGENMVPISSGFNSQILNQGTFIGYVNPSQKIWVTIGLNWRNEENLNEFLKEVNNPYSPNFGKYLSYQEFKERYAPPIQEYIQVLNWIKNNNVHIAYTYPMRNAIVIHDTFKKIGNLLHVQFGYFKSNNPSLNRYYFAAINSPSVPLDLKNIISGINGLNNATRFKLHYYTASSGIDYLSGADVSKMYHVYELYNNTPDGSASNTHIFATGLRVATVLWEGADSYGNQYAPFDPDAVTYYYQHVIPTWIQNLGVMSTVHYYGTSGTVAPGSNTDGQVSTENELDLEMVGTLAPGVDAFCVYGPGGSNGGPSESNFPDNEYNYILNTLAAESSPVLVAVSNSWGGGDYQVSSTTMNDVKALEAMGVTVMASSGDDGDTTSPSEPSTAAYDNYGFLAVGGTTPIPNGVDHTTLDDYATMGYNTNIADPRSNEVVWYDTTSTNSAGDHWGTQSGVSSVYSEPSWQSDYIGSYNGRVTADVSAMGNHTLIYVSSSSGTQWSSVAGTSVACPVTAGMVAMMDAYVGVNYRISNHGLGFLNPIIYKLGYDYYHNGMYSNSPPYFDVTQGATGGGGSAGTGWDQVSGWGVINAWNFIHDIGFTLSSSSTSMSINAGDSATYTINVEFPYDWTTDVGHFQISGLPSGASVSYSTNYVHPAGNGASVSFNVNIQTSSSTPAGTYNLILKAYSYNHTNGHWGNLTNTIQLNLTVGSGSSSPTAPSAPQNLQATAGDGQVSLSWQAPSSNGGAAITEYKIYRGTSSGSESYLAEVSGSTLSYTDTSVTNGQTYYYYVTAVNSAGESPASNEVSATPQASTSAPSAPQNLQASAGNGYVQLSWQAPSNNGGAAITEYKIYRGTSSGGESYLTETSSLSYNDTSVTNGQTYYYYVTAVNSAGESPASNEVSATPQAPPSPSPSTLKILLVLDNGASSYKSYFTDALDADGYSYDVWDISSSGSPSASTLEQYPVVIWTTGSAWSNILSSTDQSNLETYLNNGGALYLSSQDFLYEVTGGYDESISNTFITNYLGVDYVANDVGYSTVAGVSGTFAAGFSSISLSNYPFTNYDDELGLSSYGHALFYSTSDGYVTGDFVNTSTYRTVFTAFSFEAVQNSDSSTSNALLKAIVDWLSGESTSIEIHVNPSTMAHHTDPSSNTDVLQELYTMHTHSIETCAIPTRSISL
ncbi:putative protease [Aciduliprofundum sp. MAR08-339]|uniref:protease pro-enzyme activation domain-containing protein n=1 Tax=Aciduliprofundum sp. (strain MAR08-339) TaxID=673860 RepID=UPI0002A4A64F|nr:putative protease [Aciduliprofundum sp. MAR08-339]